MANNPQGLGHLLHIIAAGIVIGWIVLVVRDLRREMRRDR